MKKISIVLVFIFTVICSFSFQEKGGHAYVYKVRRLAQPLKIDSNWEKAEWRKSEPVAIENFMGQIPAFKPTAMAKLMYDDESLYLIFRVDDRHVRIQTSALNGPVSGDACVEFFFSPDSNFPERYFNLEINAGGVPLMGYHINGHKEYKLLQPDELRMLKIAHSLAGPLHQEIAEPVTWTVECRIPFSLLKKYSNIIMPKKGVSWKANFYKTASKSSNLHWITWSPVINAKPNFHLPGFFGTIEFK